MLCFHSHWTKFLKTQEYKYEKCVKNMLGHHSTLSVWCVYVCRYVCVLEIIQILLVQGRE